MPNNDNEEIINVLQNRGNINIANSAKPETRVTQLTLDSNVSEQISAISRVNVCSSYGRLINYSKIITINGNN